jgi:hypothetical protein
MGKPQDRAAALSTLVAAQRAQKTALAAVMATVSVNTISAQNITDINAAGAAYDAAIQVANATINGAGAFGND